MNGPASAVAEYTATTELPVDPEQALSVSSPAIELLANHLQTKRQGAGQPDPGREVEMGGVFEAHGAPRPGNPPLPCLASMSEHSLVHKHGRCLLVPRHWAARHRHLGCEVRLQCARGLQQERAVCQSGDSHGLAREVSVNQQ